MPLPTYVQPIRIPFRLDIGLGKSLARFVYVYLIVGERILVIDSGVAGSESVILDHVEKMGRTPRDIEAALITHPHPDHIGGLLGLATAVNCKVAAHCDAIPWIEDVESQFRARPVPGFRKLVAGPVKVDRLLHDGDVLELGDGNSLCVLHTPGHAAGHIALLAQRDGILFSGDAIPPPGTLPIYDDPVAVIQSLERLRAIDGLRVLFSSWDEPREGNVYDIIDAGMSYIRHVHELVLGEQAGAYEMDSQCLTEQVLAKLRFGGIPINPILVRTIEAHRRAGEGWT